MADTGTGVPPEELPYLFDRFHQVRAARSRSHEGSGIGLALVKDLVELHAGTVSVSSRPGEGSTFTVEVPFGTAHLAAALPAPLSVMTGPPGRSASLPMPGRRCTGCAATRT
ncbi:ATP-binding protein [Streptomyces sp. FXJ1.4098]|nr:ATP-binding protein [Streptomyces sp. FXJ1.4098]